MARPAPARSPAGILPRIIFGLALFGILVVSHLWLQKEANFAAGCSGFADVTVSNLAETMREEPGCATVTNSVYASFLGVPNIIWGLLFYLVVASLRFAYSATGDDRLRRASFGLAGLGVAYTLYLVYLQAAVIQAFCVLCMTSAVTVTLLLILHVMEHVRLRRPAADKARPARALKPYALVAAVFAVVLVADVVMAQQRGEAPAAAENTETATPPPAAPAEPPPPTLEIADPAQQCTYSDDYQDVAIFDQFTQGPYRGSADASVRVLEIFDPNCPHCKHLSETLHDVVEAEGAKARFYFQPFPLRDNSFGQAAALYLAAEEGHFLDLMDVMFARQDQTWGMSLDEVVDAGAAAGMDADALRARLSDESGIQPLVARIMQDRVSIVQALGDENGISVPKLLINGDLVAPTVESYSADCLRYFIEQAASGGDASTQAVSQ